MALIKCHECGNEVSTEAKTCPKCGAKPKEISAVKAVVILIGAAFVISLFTSNDKNDPAKNQAPAECAKDDLHCQGDKAVVAAGVYCKDPVERMAKHSVRWTDGTFEPKFSHFRWGDKATGSLTMIGDKAEFQNGFGAFTPVVYECDLAADRRTVLDVRVHEGRLPK